MKLNNKIALITGASRGIGKAVALEYARQGAHVIALARTAGALEELDDEIQKIGGKATLLPMDLGKLDEIDKIGPSIAQKFGKLDIFVGNAGLLGPLTPAHQIAAKDVEKVMKINYTVNVKLIQSLDPILRAAPAGRMIFTSSGLGEMPLAYFGAYCASKAALNLFVKSYAAEIEKTNMKVNLVDPGVVDTEMLREGFPGGYPGGAKKPEDVVKTYVDLALESCKKHGEVVKA
jgi:NAD(P)-dependent dehydrogenase (short-subunit alcohol dehydrogenase family)